MYYSFCWTKMGSESGETLTEILTRKETERDAGEGVFLWGIGNAIENGIQLLAESTKNPPVLFSPIKTRPKKEDEHPDNIFMWTAYIDQNGAIKPLPRHSLVTSRTNKRHYALFCYSQTSIVSEQYIGQIDFNRLRNLRTKSPLGYSQVTAVVENMTADDFLDVPWIDETTYPVWFSAELIPPYAARLANPVQLDLEALEDLWNETAGEFKGWCDMMKLIHSRYGLHIPEQGSLDFDT